MWIFYGKKSMIKNLSSKRNPLGPSKSKNKKVDGGYGSENEMGGNSTHSKNFPPFLNLPCSTACHDLTCDRIHSSENTLGVAWNFLSSTSGMEESQKDRNRTSLFPSHRFVSNLFPPTFNEIHSSTPPACDEVTERKDMYTLPLFLFSRRKRIWKIFCLKF